MKNFLIISFLSFLLAFNVNAGTDGKIELSKKSSKPVKDCFEKLNRSTFSLNLALDRVIFKPAAKAYRVLPSPVRKGTSNALENLSSLITIPNNFLQGDFKKAGVNTGRFIINTTVGVIGIFDVAKKINFPEYEKEDYGQTFGTWGISAGCYLVLPVLGPSTVRNTAGSFVNALGGDLWYNASVHANNQYLSKGQYITTKVLSGINFRAKNINSIENLEKNSVDFYASMRSLYLQNRQQKIANSNSMAESYDDSDWEEIETQ
tara:strand:- start:666 stop:1451 length:786 start_codon:yes stop_codon:yes gene_type:complete